MVSRHKDTLFIFPGSRMALIRICSTLSSDKLTMLPKMCSISTYILEGTFANGFIKLKHKIRIIFWHSAVLTLPRCIINTCLLSLVMWIFLQLNKKVSEGNSRTKCNKLQGRAASLSLACFPRRLVKYILGWSHK